VETESSILSVEKRRRKEIGLVDRVINDDD
jgi:hypothetical protein